LHEVWPKHWPNYLNAYNIILNAERHTDEQIQANPSNLETKDHIVFARLAGYLFLEFFNRREILPEGPGASPGVKQI